jgi:uncharacterized protein
MPASDRIPHYPGRAPIDAYGNGGFRFASMSHRGSLLLLPSGIYGWDVTRFEELRLAHLAIVLAGRDAIDFLLLGTGDEQQFPNSEIRSAFEAVRMGLEPMTTGAAARTYNVLLAEKRRVAAALIAVS